MSVIFHPTIDRLLVTLEPEPEMSQVIQVQKKYAGLCRWGTVTAIGPEVRDVKPGQRVLCNIIAGVEMAQGMLIDEDAVWAHEHQSHE
jgi:NADPH:quinone reductase-like Zn-dependent oxidoreductase